MQPIIQVRGLGKQYRLGKRQTPNGTLRDVLAETFRRRPRHGAPTAAEETFWAVKDISFDVHPGEVVGIIGRNGAGKSTLLKILSRITEPTTGMVELYGRVGTLLEVGTGFHPELSGRENIYLNGAILGMRRQEIDRKFDEIVAFADIDRFLDTPVKRYSSGMYVRLAFAVAAHLEPDILIVDEVLAVGDLAFQKKCLGKMGDVAREGRTVLVVTHNTTSIARLCQQAVWLESGSVRQQGRASDVIQAFLSDGIAGGATVEFPPDLAREAQIVKVEMLTADGRPSNSQLVQYPFSLRIDYQLARKLEGYRVGARFRLADGLEVLVTSSPDTDGELWTAGPGRYTAVVEVPDHLLGPGRYFVTVFLGQPGVKSLDRHENVLALHLEGRPKAYDGQHCGLIATPLKWHVA